MVLFPRVRVFRKLRRRAQEEDKRDRQRALADAYTVSDATYELFTAYKPHGSETPLEFKSKEELRSHILSVRRAALDAYRNFVCIEHFRFATPRISTHPELSNVLASKKQKTRVLDVGCCMGTDLRYLIALSGVAPENVFGCDIEPGTVGVIWLISWARLCFDSSKLFFFSASCGDR